MDVGLGFEYLTGEWDWLLLTAHYYYYGEEGHFLH